MKKYISVLLVFILVCVLVCACGETAGIDFLENIGTKEPSPIYDSDPIGESSQPESEIETEQPSPPPPEKVVDIDLSNYGSTMLFAEVTNILSNPDDYLGKIIKVRGSLFSSYYGETDKYYQYVVIGDAAACCQQGIEFVWKGEHTFPDDYPDDYSLIEVVGVYGQYEEFDISYFYLEVDDITVLM